jgi:hypothetical protein
MSGGYADYDLENQQLERRRRMAEMLAQQGMGDMPKGGMVGNTYVAPSWTQQLSAALDSPLAAYQMKGIDRQQKELGQRKQTEMTGETQRLADALYGRKGDQLPPDVAGPVRPDMAPDMDAARRIALTGKSPQSQFVSQQMLAAALKPAESPYAKIDPSKFTPASIQAFAAAGGKDMGLLVPREKIVFDNLGGSGQYRGEYSSAPVGTVAKTAPPLAADSIVKLDAAGNLVENTPVTSIKGRLAEKGATRVDVKTNVKTGESLAGQVGPMMRDSASAAEGAVKQVDAAQRIVNAVDSNKIIAGPGATPQVFLKQLGQKMGVGGKDDPEILANTRSAIRGLAELTLQGRQQMKGQGAITESEGELAKRAMSGDIDGLTPAEIKQLAKASERAARFNYALHERKMQTMRQNPDLGGVAPFYEAPAMPAEVAPGSAVKVYDPASGTFK